MRVFYPRFENDLASRTDAAMECIRYLNYHTLGIAIPGPVACRLFGNLAQVGHLLPQTLDQLAAGLDQSLEFYDIYEEDGIDPATRVDLAVVHLYEARANASRIGDLLDRAQDAVRGQNYRC